MNQKSSSVFLFFCFFWSAHLFCQMNFCSKNEVWVSPPPFSTLFHFKILTHFGKKEINSKNNLEEKNKKLFAEKKQQKRRLKNWLNLSEIPNIHCQRSRTRRSCQKNWVPKGKIRKRQNSVLFNLRFFFLSTQYCQFNARETKNWEVFRFLSTLDPPPRFNNVSKKKQLLCKNACKLQCVFSYFIKNVADWFSIHKKWQATESAAVS